MLECVYIGGPWDGVSSKDSNYLTIKIKSDPGSETYCSFSHEQSKNGIYAMYIEAKPKNNIIKHYFVGYRRGPWLEKKK